MRIPTAEDDIGYFCPIGDYYMFVNEVTIQYPTCITSHRRGTFKEFKELYPFLAYTNARVEYRKKKK